MLKDINKEIESIFYPYIKVKSTTGTSDEKKAEEFLIDYIKNIDYFKLNPSHFGAYRIAEDHLNRSVCWALIKGSGDDTVVLMHHYDVVDTEDFKLLKDFAYTPLELEERLHRIKETFTPDAKQDLESGEYLFGRGTADMKSGGSIQLALMKRYSELENFKGNIILIAVPDEENLSAGMRSAVKLLSELQDKYNLNFTMMINSEPHQRKDNSVGMLSEGSVGKIMPFAYVRGYLSHISDVFEGFNPVNLLCEIVRSTELNLELSDSMKGETSPPPTWLYLRDNKEHYDVSMPLSASGCLSILTLNRTPDEILSRLIDISQRAFSKVIDEMKERNRKFMEGMGKKYNSPSWEPKVVTFKNLYDEALKEHGDEFKKHYEECLREIKISLTYGKLSMIKASFKLIEAVYDYIDDLSPRVVIGLIPPYYPNVSNLYFKNISEGASSLSKALIGYAKENFVQKYETEYFFTGISDLSYTSMQDSSSAVSALQEFMPLYGKFYEVPLDIVERISMPCINIGPWGKDFHKLTERVLKEDMFHRTPLLVHKAISHLLNW